MRQFPRHVEKKQINNAFVSYVIVSLFLLAFVCVSLCVVCIALRKFGGYVWLVSWLVDYVEVFLVLFILPLVHINYTM